MKKQARDLQTGDIVTLDNGGIDRATIQHVEVYPNNVRVHFSLGYLDIRPDREVETQS